MFATIAGATHKHTHTHAQRTVPLMANAMASSAARVGDLDSPMHWTQCALRLDAVSDADLLINLTNSALIFADFVRHTQMHLICLKRMEAEAEVGGIAIA